MLFLRRVTSAEQGVQAVDKLIVFQPPFGMYEQISRRLGYEPLDGYTSRHYVDDVGT